MTSQEILDIILHEINGNWSLSNAHGVDLRRCLLSQPEKSIFQDFSGPDADPSGKTELWLVLEEVPETKGGYKIVFDEQRGKFGLATTDSRNELDAYLGAYGTFLTALESM